MELEILVYLTDTTKVITSLAIYPFDLGTQGLKDGASILIIFTSIASLSTKSWVVKGEEPGFHRFA